MTAEKFALIVLRLKECFGVSSPAPRRSPDREARRRRRVRWREIPVRGSDDLIEVLAALSLVRVPGERVIRVGNDEEHVEVAPVAHQKRALHPRHSGELLLDPTRGDRLPAAVLVDVLDAIDDFVVAARAHAEDVPRRKPLLPARSGGGVLQVVRDVRPGHLKLAFARQPCFDER
jgi:hypothetical protein